VKFGQCWGKIRSVSSSSLNQSLTAPRPQFPVDAKIDLHLAARSESWRLNLYVNSVSNERGIAGAQQSVAVGVTGGCYGSVIQPRIVGLSAVRKFLMLRSTHGVQIRFCLVGGVILGSIGASGLPEAFAVQEAAIHVISSRPDAVSGGDVLVQLSAQADSDWIVRLDGQDVTRSFRRSESGRLVAILTGLKPGRNALEVRMAGRMRSRMELVDHPSSGPVFSGSRQEPFICQTEANGLGPAVDADCSAKSIVQYYYKSTEPIEIDISAPLLPAPILAPGFKAYDPSAARPTDVAMTVTSDGRRVPYIVRREVGTINRAVYDIQFLQDPGEPLPTAWTYPTAGWNGRLVYLVDGGCGAGYHQGTLVGPVGLAGQPFLAEGYATATSTLNVTGNDCNGYVSAESLSMVKEHFIKTYGRPAHTIGWGDSGGAYNQLLTAQNYPGLLDGLITNVSFPDFFTTAQSVTDCAVVDRAFSTSQHVWSDAQKAAVSGFSSWQTCKVGWSDGHGHNWPILDPAKLCSPLLPKEAIYDRTANPKGIRCDLYDNEINVLGRDPRTGDAYRPLDNAGVQYGLVAFNHGQIDAEQFIELNERIGGLDEDGRVVPERTVAAPQLLKTVYARGVVLTGGGGLSQVPIIDWRPYDDDSTNNHDSIRSLIIRARLMAANGNAENHVILTFPRWSVADVLFFMASRRWEAVYPDRARYLVHQMVRWLDNIAADTADRTLAAKVARDKPEDLADGCWATNGEHIVEQRLYGGHGRCDREYPAYADPRIAAGGPLADDILKCSLKPVNASGYTRPLSSEQLARLRAIFPNGVCDYSRPGIGQEITRATWQRF